MAKNRRSSASRKRMCRRKRKGALALQEEDGRDLVPGLRKQGVEAGRLPKRGQGRRVAGSRLHVGDAPLHRFVHRIVRRMLQPHGLECRVRSILQACAVSHP